MKTKLIPVFASKEYFFLSWLKGHEQNTSRGAVINFSQEEIAAECGYCTSTVNKWLQSLEKVKCVEKKKGGSYCVTKMGNAVISKMEELEEIIGGEKNGH